MTVLTYAGIGARATSASTLADMTVIARWLARTRVPAVVRRPNLTPQNHAKSIS